MAYTEILLPQTYINANLIDEWDFWVKGYAAWLFANTYPAVAVSAMAANDSPNPPVGSNFTWGKDGYWAPLAHPDGHFTLTDPTINGLIQSVAVRLLLHRQGGGIAYHAKMWTHGVRYIVAPPTLAYIGQSPYPPGVGWEIWEWLTTTNPNTGLAWTLPELIALEAGFYVIHAALSYIAIDQLYVNVIYSKIPPTVATQSASGVTSDQATLNGSLTDDGGEVCALSFQWGDSPSLGNTVAAGTGSTGASFSALISGLLTGTNYYFRAVATNSRGTSYGVILSLTSTAPPPGGIPTVLTLAAVEVTESSGKLKGLVQDSLGRYGDVRFEWGGTTAYGNSTPWHEGYKTGDMFEERLLNLAEGAVYHFRAQFRGSGIVSGSDAAFSTLSNLGPLTFVDEETLSRLEGL